MFLNLLLSLFSVLIYNYFDFLNLKLPIFYASFLINPKNKISGSCLVHFYSTKFEKNRSFK